MPLERGLPGDPRVRTLLDHLRQRLRPSPHLGLSPSAPRGPGRARNDLPLLPHDVGGRGHDRRERGPVPRPAGRIGSRRGRDPRRPRGPRVRPRRSALPRHGRHHGEDLPHRERDPGTVPDLRGRPPVPGPQGERPAGPDPGHRDGGDRGGGRLDRPRRRHEPAPGGAGERGLRARPGVLRAGRGEGDGDRREPRPREARPGAVRGREDRARARARRGRPRTGRRRAARARRPVARGRGGRDGRREHGERGAGPRHRAGQGHRAPCDGRVRGRGAAPCRAARAEARHRPGGDPEGRGGGVRDRVPARTHRLRGGAHAPGRLPRLRCRRHQRDAGRDGGGSDGRRAGRGAARRAPRGEPRRRAPLRRTGPRPSHRARRRAARPGRREGAQGPLRRAVPGGLRTHHRRARHPERLLVGDRRDRGGARLAGGDAAGPDPGPARADGHRSIYDASLGETVRCPVYSRFDLAPGTEIAGPAIIAEEETATFVPAGFSAALNSFEYIVMDNRAGRAV